MTSPTSSAPPPAESSAKKPGTRERKPPARPYSQTIPHRVPTKDAGDDSATRARLVRAAVDCILEEGYYRASSNRIAARVGLSWGVIQYHFGTRENLLLAVVQDGADRLHQLLSTVTVEGDTDEARLDSLARAIWKHYGRPEFLASMQATLNLAKDPRTSAATSRILIEVEEPISQLWLGLVQKALPTADRRAAATVFETLRGMAIDDGLRHAFPHRRSPARVDRTLVVRALVSSLNGSQ